MNFAFPATLRTGEGLDSVTAFNVDFDEPVFQANASHPMWDEILEGLRIGDPNVWNLFDIGSGLNSRFKEVSERISYNGSEILFDGDSVNSALSEHLMRTIEAGDVENYRALAMFWEKLASNPSENSREQAYSWLSSHKFQITSEGDVVGYKYVNRVSDDTYASVHRSEVRSVPSAFVNGVPVAPRSAVPQKIGDVVTMPRSEVVEDPSQACRRGLHVGHFDYVGGFTRELVLEVHVNPRDIVSVPSDGNGGKVRVCRYYVAARATNEERPATPVRNENYGWTPDVSYRG